MTPATASRLTLGASAALALVAPVWLLSRPAPVPPPAPWIATRPITPRQAPALEAALARPLFAVADGPLIPEAQEADAGPQLIGIVGRLGRDAVALVRRADGGTATLAIGESSEGWKLESIAREAVLFTRGTQKKRIDLSGAGAVEAEAPS